MKCVILAGGFGDRLFPLSRRNYPKQFLYYDAERSIFQETVTRNIPFCDEFIIVTNQAYAPIIEGQLLKFQGLSYRLILEEEGRGTAAAVAMASLLLDENDEIFVTPSDLMIRGDGYSDALYRAKELAADGGRLVLFGVAPRSARETVDYIRVAEYDADTMQEFIEKPPRELAEKLFGEPYTFWNSGLFLCNNQTLRREFAMLRTSFFDTCKAAFQNAKTDESGNISIASDDLANLTPTGFERLLIKNSRRVSVVPLKTEWNDVSDFSSYTALFEGEAENGGQENETKIIENCENTHVINTDPSTLVVANRLQNTLVVNTPNAVYVTDTSHADDIRDIISRHSLVAKADDDDAGGNVTNAKLEEFFSESPKTYRPWGVRELICQEFGYRVRKVEIYPGMSLSYHAHENRNETYTVVSGELSVQLDGKFFRVGAGETINVRPGAMHRLFNDGGESAVVIEVDTGAEIIEQDMRHEPGAENVGTKTETLPDVLRLKPAYKNYLWGGEKLREIFHKETPYEKTAEAWELSAHPDGQSIISGGAFDGTPFGDFIDKYGGVSCGWKSEIFDRFPVLVKLIDATKTLSVQIHPDDDYAFQNESEFGKNEVWYVMDAAAGAYLYCGFSRDVTRDEVEKRIRENSLTEILNRIEVRPGDVVFVPAGTVHAIGEGILICEIQQNSNSTYRIYDYNRLDRDGKPRKLHIKKALDVVNLSAYYPDTKGFRPPVKRQGFTEQILTQCKYFQCTKYVVEREAKISVDDSSFKSVLVLAGSGEMTVRGETFSFTAGDSFFVSAGRKLLTLAGACEVIVTNV